MTSKQYRKNGNFIKVALEMRNKRIKNRETDHENQIKKYGKVEYIRAWNGRRRTNHKRKTPSTIKGITRTNKNKITSENFFSILSSLREKPQTLKHLLRNKDIKRVNNTPATEKSLARQLEKLYSLGLIQRTVIQVKYSFSRNKYFSYAIRDTWLFKLPDNLSFIEKLEYLTKLKMLTEQGYETCKHTFYPNRI